MFPSDDCLKKIEPMNKLLESRFGIRVEMSDADHLAEVATHYEQKRNLLIRTMGECQAMQSPEYAKAVLISEAIRVLLREIAPKRARRKK